MATSEEQLDKWAQEMIATGTYVEDNDEGVGKLIISKDAAMAPFKERNIDAKAIDAVVKGTSDLTRATHLAAMRKTSERIMNAVKNGKDYRNIGVTAEAKINQNFIVSSTVRAEKRGMNRLKPDANGNPTPYVKVLPGAASATITGGIKSFNVTNELVEKVKDIISKSKYHDAD